MVCSRCCSVRLKLFIQFLPKEGKSPMNQKSSLIFISILIVVISLSLAGCNLLGTDEPEISTENRVLTIVAETMAVEQYIQTVVAETMAAARPTEVVQEEPEPELVDISEPTATELQATPILPTPTITYTPTSSVPMVSVSADTNCRTGPGQPYDIIGALLVGEQAEVVGAALDGGYWIIMNPDLAGECWLWANYATVVGETAGLPISPPPPTPTPIYNWTGTWTTSFGKPEFMHETRVITLTQTDNTVTGSFTIGCDTVFLSGTLSTDYTTLTGTWSQPPTSGTFVFRLINVNQFIGNMDNGDYEWCGYRAGAGVPSPCMGP